MKKSILLATVAACCVSQPLWAQNASVFSLGQVTASAPAAGSASLGGDTVTQDDIRLLDRNTLDTAVATAPGVTVSEVGARNESNIWIRGFDRWRVPLSIDGIPVYLPADNRIDFGRFTTADISEIQIAKGFSSVIDGPGALGGAVNLVSRKVAKPEEGELRLSSSFDGNGAFNGFITDGFAGVKRDLWYAQVSASDNNQSHFRLSEDYQPGTLENGGNRNHSSSQDSKVNLKAGFTPKPGDEYSLNVIDQTGEKDNALPDSQLSPSSVNSQKYWTWPSWDKQSVYWLSKTGIDDAGSAVKVRAYWDHFRNQIDGYDNANYTTQLLSSGKVMDSTYNDHAIGGSTELDEVLLGGRDVLKLSLHYRHDQHKAENGSNVCLVSSCSGANSTKVVWFNQPWLRDEEDTYSAAAENTFHPATGWDLTTGLSYDYRHMDHAEDWNAVGTKAPYGYILDYPDADKHAINPEVALAYHLSETGVAHASVARRSRFPTIFELYSQRFGTATSNPYLLPETSTNYEVGVNDTVKHVRLGGNLFYSRVENSIESVAVTLPTVGATTQSQNVGTETHQGFELEAASQVLSQLELGGNYTYMVRVNQSHTAITTDTPNNKLFLYANWQPLSGLSVVPSFEYDSKRWLNSANNNAYYYRGGDFAVTNLKVAYDINDHVEIEGGVKNLFDINYEIEDGYHAAGRNFFTSLRVKF